MAFLKQSDVLYYFPFASDAAGMQEETKGITWADAGGWIKQCTSGLLGSGAYSLAPATNRADSLATRSPSYSGSTGTTSLTYSLWTSGVGANARFAAGWQHVSNGNLHAVQLTSDGSNRLAMNYWINDSPSTSMPFAGATGPICNNNGWTLLTTRIETIYAESTWWISGSVSINGGSWQQLGRRALGASTWSTIADGKTLIGWYNRVGSETDQRPLDEFIVWQNAARFTDEELQNLYDLGVTHNLPMSAYSPQFAQKAIGTTSTYVGGVDPNTRKFLEKEKVLYYLGARDSTYWEEVKGNVWQMANAADATIASGYLGSGIRFQNDGAYNDLYPAHTGLYPEGTGVATSLTEAFWCSGLTDKTVFTQFGFYDTNRQVVLEMSPGTTRMNVYDGGWGILSPSGGGMVQNGWFFCVARMEVAGSTVSGCISINGQPWQSLGTASKSKTLNGSRPRFGVAHGAGQTPIPILDEIIIWKDASRFTDDQLSKLYELGHTYQRPMNEYQEQYADWYKESGVANAYVGGFGLQFGTANGFVGNYVVATQVSGSIAGHLVESGISNGYASGIGHKTGEIEAYLANKWVLEGIDARVQNVGQVSGWVDAQVQTQQIVTGHIPTFIRGTLQHQRPLFLKTIPPEVSGSVQGLIYGSETGDTWFRIGQANAIIYHGSEAKPLARQQPMFLRAAPAPGVVEIDRRIPLFLPGGNVAKVSIPAILSVAGQAYEAAWAFMYGDGDPLSADYTPIRVRHSCFCKTVPGAYAVLRASLTGDLLFPSGSCEAFLMGCSGLVNASRYAFSAGYNTDKESTIAILTGVYGIATGEVGLYISGVCTPVSGSMLAYSHGY